MAGLILAMFRKRSCEKRCVTCTGSSHNLGARASARARVSGGLTVFEVAPVCSLTHLTFVDIVIQ